MTHVKLDDKDKFRLVALPFVRDDCFSNLKNLNLENVVYSVIKGQIKMFNTRWK